RARAPGGAGLRAAAGRAGAVRHGGGGEGGAAQPGVAGRAAHPRRGDRAGHPDVAGRGAGRGFRLPRGGRRGAVAGTQDGRVLDRLDDGGLRPRPVHRPLPGSAGGAGRGQDRGARGGRRAPPRRKRRGPAGRTRCGPASPPRATSPAWARRASRGAALDGARRGRSADRSRPARRGHPGMLIAAPRLITGLPGTGVLAPGYLAVHGGLITEVGEGPPPKPPGLELRTGVLVPGLVDLQVNGYYGADLADCDPEGWALVARRLPETGTTAFLPTFITAPVTRLATALRSARKIAGAPAAGARVLGVHLEGPFLSPARAGAHRPDWMVPPSPDAVAELLDAGRGVLRLVTLAPETDGALAAISALVAAGGGGSGGPRDATPGPGAAPAGPGAPRGPPPLHPPRRPAPPPTR